jgi:N-acetylneuraminate synthase
MSRVQIIAEAGVNHNGSRELALELVDVAARAGADIVKFQTFRAENLVTSSAPRADYQAANTGETGSQYTLLKALELSRNDFQAILERCQKRRIEFLSTPFDLESLSYLTHDLSQTRLKISSGDLTNAPLLLAAARSAEQIILSTGMSNLEEVEQALMVLAFGFTRAADVAPGIDHFQKAYESSAGQNALKDHVTLLHCTTEYPAPFSDIHLRAMDTLRGRFGLRTGYSDHSVGISVPIAAVARGAGIIEKHFTLDRAMPGPDHKASLDPEELRRMVTAIREVEQALGNPEKIPVEAERKNMAVARKSLVAARSIRKGETFSASNLAVKRPGTGVAPMHYWEWIGRTAARDYAPDELIEP